jgi:hypothetical protein
MAGPFRSLFTREREFPSRVKTELEKRDRERLVSITEPYPDAISAALKEMRDEVGESRLQEATPNFSNKELILNGDTIFVLSYLEHFIHKMYDLLKGRRTNVRRSDFEEVLSKVGEVLITEGLLWEIQYEAGKARFRQIESEAMEDIDKEVQALAEEEPWDDALKGYNDAFERYLDGEFDERIPKKLYYSIEEVLKTICVDKEGWTDNRELVHSEYFQMMKDNDFYHAHGATVAELNQFLESLERMVAKISDDRKQRHAYHDRTYATLLIHQVGAYLYFLINRHKEYSG